VGCVGVTDWCSFPIVGRGERARAEHVPRPQVQGEPWHAGGDRPSSWGGGANGHKPWPADHGSWLTGHLRRWHAGSFGDPLCNI
jgi:hypothetical protein